MFPGIMMPLITPFTVDDDVDLDVYMDMIDGSLDAGVHGFYLMASQGQGPTMTAEERVKTMKAAIAHINKRVPVIIHVGTTHLTSTVELVREADAAGADAIAVLPPYFYSDHTSDEVDAHFVGAGQATKLPMFIYENEKYTGIGLPPSRMARIAELVPTLAGAKLSYSSTMQIYAYVQEVPERVGMYPGSIIHLLPTMELGIRGCIPPSAVLFPPLAVDFWQTLADGDWPRAVDIHTRLCKIQRLWAQLHRRYGRSAAREALRLQGYDVKIFPRWANAVVDEEGIEEIRKFNELVALPAESITTETVTTKTQTRPTS